MDFDVENTIFKFLLVRRVNKNEITIISKPKTPDMVLGVCTHEIQPRRVVSRHEL